MANLKLLHDEQQEDKHRTEAKERRKREKKRRESQAPKFSKTMDVPNYWDIEKEQEGSEAESSAQAEHRIEPTNFRSQKMK